MDVLEGKTQPEDQDELIVDDDDDGYFPGVRESEQERYDGQHSPPEW